MKVMIVENGGEWWRREVLDDVDCDVGEGRC